MGRRSPELDYLKSQEQNAFSRKQAAFERYAHARDLANNAHTEMQSRWNERVSARETMNQEYEEMQRQNEHHQAVWDEYGRIRDYNNSRIESLRYEADREHQEMVDCFDRASDAYNYGNKSEAPMYSAEGRDHKDRRDALNAEVSALIQEIKDAKSHAEYSAPRTDSSAFHRAKAEFESAKARHTQAETEFKRLKTERDHYKQEFDQAQAEHTRLKEEFQRKLAEIKANNQRERDRTLDKAGVRYSDRKDAKIVKKSDGTTQVYHGGIGKGDGIGHGHTALDQFGNKTYDRGAFEAHGSQNYTDKDNGFTMYDRRARTQTEIGGTGKGNYIDVKTGKGHTTQWYKDGQRISWDTEDGGKTERSHWTNQNVPTGHPDRHKKPSDANR